MTNESLTGYFDFASFVGAFKEIERFRGQFYWRDYPQRDRYDSVADVVAFDPAVRSFADYLATELRRRFIPFSPTSSTAPH